MLTKSGSWDKPVEMTGNTEILKSPLTAFYCSRKYLVKAVLPSFDWAEQARDNGVVVISGFHSLLEQNVRDILLMGSQPLVWAIARCPYKQPPPWANKPLDDGRLLIVSTSKERQQSSATTDIRNRYVISVAENIVVGYATPEGRVDNVLGGIDKPVQYLAQ